MPNSRTDCPTHYLYTFSSCWLDVHSRLHLPGARTFTAFPVTVGWRLRYGRPLAGSWLVGRCFAVAVDLRLVTLLI